MGARGVWTLGNAALGAFLALYFFWIPCAVVLHDLTQLRDPGEIPGFAHRWHRSLSPRFEEWARTRVASNRAATLSTDDVAATEWPVFSSVFYLWATEALQEAWEADRRSSSVAPAVRARGAIDAAAALVADPGHAAWVRAHWGDTWLERENLFYRMLLVGGLASYQRLTGDARYEPLLRAQATSLAAELDASPHGLLDDYPGEAYPVDVLPAYAVIRRADRVLGTDHAGVARRGVRAFGGSAQDPRTRLPAYSVDSRTGEADGPSRGVGISYMLIWAPELWPDTAQAWYDRYHEHFWQRGRLLAGFRELPRGAGRGEWFVDVDAGPVVAGFGTAASGFGIGAARTHGRAAEAYALGAEALVAAWPLPDGRLLGGRLTSNLTDAPLVAEAILLFNFTRTPLLPVAEEGRLRLPRIVPLALLLLVALGALYVGFGTRELRRGRGRSPGLRWPRAQAAAWGVLVATGCATLVVSANPLLGLLILTLGLFLPREGPGP